MVKDVVSLVVLALFLPMPAFALSPEAQEFMRITTQLEAVQCEKRKLRRAITLAEVERRADDLRNLQNRFFALDRDPKSSQQERRLGELERRMSNGKGGTIDPEDLKAISRQQTEAFYRCE